MINPTPDCQKSNNEFSPRKRVLSLVYQGAALWSIFALVETVCASWLSWAFTPSFMPPNGVFTIVVFVIFTLLGGGVGALTGLWGILFQNNRTARGWSAEDLLLLTPPGAMVLYLGYVYPPGFLLFAELGLIALILVALRMRTADGEPRLGFVKFPLLICIATFGLPWLIRDGFKDSSAFVKLFVVIAFLFLIFLAGNLLSRRRKRKPSGGRGRLRIPQTTGYSILAAAVLASAFFPESAILLQPATATHAANGPNILLISLDTVRADHMSVFGYARTTTPRLEEFARDAVVYERAMSTGDMTLSSHASMLTGLYPREHGAHYDTEKAPDGRPLAENIPTLAELLDKAGYRTYAVVSNTAYLDRKFGMARGFHYYDDRQLEHFFAQGPDYSLRNIVQDFLKPFFPPEISDPEFRPAEEINAQAVDMLEANGRGHRPFFMFLNYMDAHWPYLPPPPYNEYYPGRIPGYSSDRYFATLERICSLRGEISVEEKQHLISQYDGAIAYLDEQLALLFDRLRDLGLYENSLIIVTADHGEAFGDNGFISHGMSVYEDQIHVPLIIKFPNAAYTGRVTELVSGIDILPTIAAVTGLEVPFQAAGVALSDLSISRNRAIFSESYQNRVYSDWSPRFQRIQRAAMRRNLKAVFSDQGEKELFDLFEDPEERHNLFEQSIADAKSLETALEDWLNSVTPLNEEVNEIDFALQHRLRTLGYIR